MKAKILNTAAVLALAATMNTATAQTPNTFNYQAVITTEDGAPVQKQEITVEVSIRQGSKCETNPSSCDLVWQELHKPTTNEFGSFSIEIGDPEAILGGSANDFSKIDWLNTTNGQYYMQVRVDFGQASYLNGMTDLGTTRFSAVPYALAAQSAKTADFANGIQADENDKIGNTIGQLADVTITNPADGEILKYNNGTWENASFELELGNLSDVTIKTPNKSDVLAYNYTEQKWQNKPLTFTTIEGVDDTGAKTGDVLTYNATDKTWEAKPPSESGASNLADLKGDVLIKTDLDDGQILKYNGTTKKWENADPAANDLWQTAKNDDNDTYLYSKYKIVGIGTFTTEKPKAMFHVYDGSSTMINGAGITSGNKEYRCAGTGIIALGGTYSDDLDISKGTACIVGNGSFAGKSNIGTQDPINNIVMGFKSLSYGGNGKIAVGDYLELGSLNYCALFGSNLRAGRANQLICGKYNAYSATDIFIVADGTAAPGKNIFTVNADGTAKLDGNLVQTSDLRLKTNIATLENSLESVLKLRGVTFNWKKAEDGKKQYGFIAQEVEEVFPDLVGTDSNGYKTLNYSGVIPVLTEAIKTQQDEIETLKNENAQLKTTLEQLIQRIEALENK